MYKEARQPWTFLPRVLAWAQDSGMQDAPALATPLATRTMRDESRLETCDNACLPIRNQWSDIVAQKLCCLPACLFALLASLPLLAFLDAYCLPPAGRALPAIKDSPRPVENIHGSLLTRAPSDFVGLQGVVVVIMTSVSVGPAWCRHLPPAGRSDVRVHVLLRG